MRWLGAMILGAALFAGGMVTEAALSSRMQSELPVPAPQVGGAGALPQRLRQMLTPVCTEENLVRELQNRVRLFAREWEGRPDMARLENAVWVGSGSPVFQEASRKDVWVAACLTVLSAK